MGGRIIGPARGADILRAEYCAEGSFTVAGTAVYFSKPRFNRLTDELAVLVRQRQVLDIHPLSMRFAATPAWLMTRASR